MSNLAQIDENSTYFKYVVNNRIPIGFAGAILFLAFSSPTKFSVVFGLPFALLGLLIRTWSSGVVVKSRELATEGPYAMMRNPLYLGSYFMAGGVALMSGSPFLLVLALVVFPLIYDGVIRKEEKHMVGRHGDAYHEYSAKVNRWIPKITPEVLAPVTYDTGRMWNRHKEWRAWLGLLAVVGYMIIQSN